MHIEYVSGVLVFMWLVNPSNPLRFLRVKSS